MSDTDYVVTITDETTTVTLTTDPLGLSGFDPRTGDLDEQETEQRLEVRVTDGSAANNLAEARTLRKLLVQAHDHWKDRRQARVYITFKESASASVYRSPLKPKSKADWDENLLRLANWRGNTQYLDLNLRRLNYWEGPEAQVPLTNPNGTDNLSGLAVYNSNDGSGGTRYNYVDIDGDDVGGDLNGATRLEIVNTFGSDRLAWVWIGQNWTNPAGFTHWLEAEDATHSGSLHTDASNSGGDAVLISIPSAAETELLTWALSSAYLDAAAGGYYKALLRFGLGSANPNVRHRLKIQYNALDLWETELLTLDNNHAIKIRDLATFQLPPWIPGLDNLEGLDFVLAAYQATGSSVSLRFDSMQVTPVGGWRALEYIGYGTPQNYRIVDDGINNRLYQDDGAGDHKMGIYVGYGKPVQLKPATDQRLYFQFHAVSLDTAEVNRTANIKLFYRPRRHSL